MLKVENLNVHYGAIHAIHGVSLEVHQGEIVSLIGANGAGKTTVLHTISGLKKATSGTVTLEGLDLFSIDPHKIVQHGMAHVPEGRRIFSEMTVMENLEMGAYIRRDKAGIDADLERSSTTSPPAGALQAVGRHSVRRRAADAGDRPRADVPAQNPADG